MIHKSLVNARPQFTRVVSIGKSMCIMQSPMRLLGIYGHMDNIAALSEEEDEQGEGGYVLMTAYFNL